MRNLTPECAPISAMRYCAPKTDDTAPTNIRYTTRAGARVAVRFYSEFLPHFILKQKKLI
jgi:hypothetical protein